MALQLSGGPILAPSYLKSVFQGSPWSVINAGLVKKRDREAQKSGEGGERVGRWIERRGVGGGQGRCKSK